MSRRPNAVVLSLETVARILTVINANSRGPLSWDSSFIGAMRDAMVEDGVITRTNHYDCTFSDFYAERDACAENSDAQPCNL
jgi:hypothetical protein